MVSLPALKHPEYLVRVRRSEYSDEVSKMNRKEKMMLDRQLKVLSKQKRVAEHILNKTIYEAECLKLAVKDRSNRALSLQQYYNRKTIIRSRNYGGGTSHELAQVAEDQDFHLPLLHSENENFLVTSHRKSHVGQCQGQSHGAPLSRRALKMTGSEPGSDQCTVQMRDKSGRDSE